MSSRGMEMELPTEVIVALIAFGGIVIGFFGTVMGAVFANRNAKQKNKTELELGMTNAQREWVSMQLDSLRTEVTSNRTHYESVIAALHQEHRSELDKQEKHCQQRLDTLSNQVDYLTKQLKAYGLELRRAGVCINPPTID